MQKNISKRPSLLMVTDTALVRKNGLVYAFGPVVRELDVFLELFETVEWIGFERPDRHDDQVMMKVPEEVKCILLPRSGGNSLLQKLGVLVRTPLMTWRILRHVLRHEVIHTRAPSSPAFIATVLSCFFRKKIWWHKYAGNWAQEHPPFFYWLQRTLLKRASWSKVTINGRWPGQPIHCISFENPCLDEAEREAGADAVQQKIYKPPYTCCFVGRLEDAKGVPRILEAIKHIGPELIDTLHLVGDGPKRTAYEKIAQECGANIIFHGFLKRELISEIYAKSHFILLPSDSEGFPKVLAEAMNYGCLPISSKISSIPHYIAHGESGFLWDMNGHRFPTLLNEVLSSFSSTDAGIMTQKAREIAERFTFAHYQRRIEGDILKLNQV